MPIPAGYKLKPAGNGHETAAGQNTGGSPIQTEAEPEQEIGKKRPEKARADMRFIGRAPKQERQEFSLAVPALPLDRSVPLPGAIVAWAFTLAAFLPALAEAATNSETAAIQAVAEAGSTTPVSAAQLINSPLQPAAPDYSQSTDHELTRLGARWDALSAPEREALLREVKLRMAQRKDADGVLMIRTQRRYGRVYSGNGRYLKIETKVIRVRPSAGSNVNKAGFGTGFEKRNAEPGAQPGPVNDATNGAESSPPLDAAMSPPIPVMRASDPSS